MAEWTKIFDQVQSVQIKSVTDTLFKWGFGGLSLGTLGLAIPNTPFWVPILVFSLSSLFLLVGLCMYVHFAFKNPEYLRSETHQQRMRAMDLLGDKDNADNPNILQLPLITNPRNKIEVGEGSPKSIEG
ncbi:MAG: hypothetical protein ACKVQV_16150 [Bacteroidia bacterium]